VTDYDQDRFVSDAAYLNELNQGVVAEFRANGGTVAAYGVGTVLLLHTTGAKSGAPRLSPLAYVLVDGTMLIIGSFAGAPKAPAWVHNLRAHPQARVEVGSETYAVTARELPAAERDAVFPAIVARAPVYGDYQAKTSRTIPVFELIRD
jgi:deazaflavin-dependent oxidoreductase (nitroreductase family)